MSKTKQALLWAKEKSAKAGAAVTSLVLMAPVMAQETDPAVAAISGQGAKVSLLGAALVGLAIVGVGFMIGIKYLKKAPRVA